jgi:hypothetical protein
VTFFVTTLGQGCRHALRANKISWRLSKDPMFVEKVRDLESVTQYCRRINDPRH